MFSYILNKLFNSTDKLQIVKLSENATVPTRGSVLAAGYDLYSAYDYVAPAHGKILVNTDIQICVPCGTYGRVAPRSGLAWNNYIDIGAGVIDQDFRGNVCVVIFNHSNTDFHIKAKDRIAQLICEKIVYPELEILQKLNSTIRGEHGFNSTGTN
ncbi:MAG: dUTP diphosphatase [Chryseobacterium sp.]